MRRENGARAFIAPPLGGWEGLNQQESVTVDASGGNWHSLLTASPLKCVSREPVWNRRAPRAGQLCVRSSESVDGFDGHSLAGA